MKTTMTAIAAAGVLALAAVSVPHDAQAGCRGCGVGLGIVGGLAAGAIIGGAIANSAHSAYSGGPGYVPHRAHAAPGPGACPGRYLARRSPVGQWGNVVGYSRPRFFCP